MNFFCRLFGHTWVVHTSAPEPRWNTTKDGVVLVPTSPETATRYYERCQRCAEERELAAALPAGAQRELASRPASS